MGSPITISEATLLFPANTAYIDGDIETIVNGDEMLANIRRQMRNSSTYYLILFSVFITTFLASIMSLGGIGLIINSIGELIEPETEFQNRGSIIAIILLSMFALSMGICLFLGSMFIWRKNIKNHVEDISHNLISYGNITVGKITGITQNKFITLQYEYSTEDQPHKMIAHEYRTTNNNISLFDPVVVVYFGTHSVLL